MTIAIDNALVNADNAEARGDLARLSETQTDTLTRARLRLMNGDETAALAVESILDLRVTMPVYRLDEAHKMIRRLTKRAKKAGLPVPSIEEVSRETRDDESTWVTVRLLGAAPVLNGWSCVATLEPYRDAEGTERTIIHKASGVESLPADYAEHPSRCLHCTKNRRRNLTFVLQHADGNFSQVGRSCLNEYLGTEALATWFVWCELREAATEYGVGGFDHALHAAWLVEHAADATRRDKTPWRSPDLRTFLAATVAHLRVNEYVRGYTGRGLLKLMRDAEHEPVTDADFAVADGVLAWLDTLVATGAATRSSYLTRLLDHVAAAGDGGGVKAANATWIASAVPTYQRTLG
jgi:hypothetical protein